MTGFSLLELMVALSLGSLLCIGIFNIFLTIKQLHQRQLLLSTTQEKMRFISFFLREKIQMAGNWSCLSQSKEPKSIVIRSYNKKQAYKKLKLTIQSKTNLLQLHECIRMHDQFRYLPIYFFIAHTSRQKNNHHINALFFKIGHHPKEELITNMTQFKIQLYHVTGSKKNNRAVKIHYKLQSQYDDHFSQSGILYVARRSVV